MTTEHPEYATCFSCTQGVRIDKNGRTRKHSRKIAFGYGIGTAECVGSYRDYAEARRIQWNAERGEFVDMPLQVDVLQHFVESRDDPVASYVEIHSWPTTKAGYGVFKDKGMVLHLYPEDEGKSFRVVLLDAEGARVQEDTKTNDGASVNGLVLRWMEELAPTGATL